MLFPISQTPDISPRRYAESLFAFLRRRTGSEYDAIRRLFEHWVTNFPSEDRLELAQRLASEDDQQFHAVFLEAFTCQLLQRTGYSVRIHPQLPWTPKRPDFQATQPNGTSAIFECVVSTEESNFERGTRILISRLLDSIESQIHSPDFFLAIHLNGKPRSQVKVNRWIKEIAAWLAQLDYDAVLKLGSEGRFHELPKRRLVHDGFEIEIEPIAKKPSRRGKKGRTIGIISPEAEFVTSRLDIAKRLKSKASHYGPINQPFVIVINCLGEMCDEEEIEEAIFGEQGLWPSTSQPLYTRVSAVLAIRHLLPWSVATVPAVLYRNPAAQHPYCGPLTQLTEATREGQRIGCLPAEIFGLSDNWPGH